MICAGTDASLIVPDLLRVIRKGPAVKSAVDDAIDQCSTVYNLRDAIEDARVHAEGSTDEKQTRMHTSKGASIWTEKAVRMLGVDADPAR